VARALKGTTRRGGIALQDTAGKNCCYHAGDGKKALFYIAEKIRQNVEKRAIAHNKSAVAPFVTLSLGVATIVPDDQGTPELLIKCADGLFIWPNLPEKLRQSMGAPERGATERLKRQLNYLIIPKNQSSFKQLHPFFSGG